MQIKLILILLFMVYWPIYAKKTFSIMIDYAGDSHYAGRIVNDVFERHVARNCAEQLKKKIEQQYQQVHVVLSHLPGEYLEPLQTANIANRMPVDLFLSLHIFYAENPIVYLYYFLSHPIEDFWKQKSSSLFIPYDQAHCTNLSLTKKYAEQIHEYLKAYVKDFTTQAVVGFPFKPLIGISAPAIGIEIGLADKKISDQFIDPLVFSLSSVLAH